MAARPIRYPMTSFSGKFRALTEHIHEGRRVAIEEAVAGFGLGKPTPGAALLDLVLALADAAP